jgi:hypothetical protein
LQLKDDLVVLVKFFVERVDQSVFTELLFGKDLRDKLFIDLESFLQIVFVLDKPLVFALEILKFADGVDH